MLSNVDIRKEIEKGSIKIIPFEETLLESNSLYFRLDNTILLPKSGLVSWDSLDKYFERKKIDEILLKPGDFIVARTFEKLAISPEFAMLIEGRSTLGRLGISVIQTAMNVEAGHGWPNPRKVVLEIKNNGPFDIILKYKMKIAKGVFFRLETPTDKPYDKFFKYGKEPDRLAPLP